MNKMNREAVQAITHPPAGGALLDPKAAAAFLNLSEWTLAAYRCAGNGPRYVKLGNRVRYTPAALAEWIESRTVASTSEHDAKKVG
jgi:predicted DNA-binding transcriptional regulator AlpA